MKVDAKRSGYNHVMMSIKVKLPISQAPGGMKLIVADLSLSQTANCQYLLSKSSVRLGWFI